MTKTVDQVLAWFAQAKGAPAPDYVFDHTKIAQLAMNARSHKRWHEWNDDKPLINDEIPY